MSKNIENTGAERLHKLIARAGIASRRAAEEIITQGRVLVNGHKIEEVGAKADPAVDRITIDGQLLRLPEGPSIVVLLHKPTGVVTTKKDPEGRTTVTHLMPEKYKHLHPIGRLDFDTSGVLFLTDDGELTHLLTHPSHGVDKVYWARVRGTVTVETLKKLEGGIYLEDGKTAPCRARVRAQTEKNALVQITLREGKNRQVRRMLEAVGHPVTSLRRVKVAGFGLDGLQPGEHRVLINAEVHQLRKAAETKPKKAATKSPTKPKTKAAINNELAKSGVAKEKPTSTRATQTPANEAQDTKRKPSESPQSAPLRATTPRAKTSRGEPSVRGTEHPLAQRVAKRFGDRSFGDKSFGDKSFGDKPFGDDFSENVKTGRDNSETARQNAFFDEALPARRPQTPANSTRSSSTRTNARAPKDAKFSSPLIDKAANKKVASTNAQANAQAKAAPKSPAKAPKTPRVKAAQDDKYASKARRGARAWGSKTRKRA